MQIQLASAFWWDAGAEITQPVSSYYLMSLEAGPVGGWCLVSEMA
jgi:hypothetical protein